MIRWTGLAPWELEFPFPGSLTATFLACCQPPRLDRIDLFSISPKVNFCIENGAMLKLRVGAHLADLALRVAIGERLARVNRGEYILGRSIYSTGRSMYSILGRSIYSTGRSIYSILGRSIYSIYSAGPSIRDARRRTLMTLPSGSRSESVLRESLCFSSTWLHLSGKIRKVR